eukprot:scaffold20054_cov125-Isochrysis_galbana.AAC.9
MPCACALLALPGHWPELRLLAWVVSAAKTPSGVAAPPNTITAQAVHYNYNTPRGFPNSSRISDSFDESPGEERVLSVVWDRAIICAVNADSLGAFLRGHVDLRQLHPAGAVGAPLLPSTRSRSFVFSSLRRQKIFPVPSQLGPLSTILRRMLTNCRRICRRTVAEGAPKVRRKFADSRQNGARSDSVRTG